MNDYVVYYFNGTEFGNVIVSSGPIGENEIREIEKMIRERFGYKGVVIQNIQRLPI